MIVMLALALPRSTGRVLPWVVGPVLGALLVIKLLDFGFFTAFDRPFNPIEDWGYVSVGIETLRESIGRTRADLVLAGVGLVAVVALLIPTLAVLRLTRVAARHRRVSTRAVAGLAVAWIVLWVFGAQLVPGRAASHPRAPPGWPMWEVRAVESALHDHARFAALIRHDPYRSTPGNQLLTALRGKDVLLVFDESYGKFAVQGSSIAPQVDSALAQGTKQLSAAGFSARSGWMRSATFGGVSWLAHSSMQSGLWVDTNDRYNQLMTSHRFTLSEAFKRAGWRVIDDVPSDDRPWPQGILVLPLRQGVQPARRRLSRPDVRLRIDARPVHLPRAAAPRALEAPPPTALRRDRHRLEPRAVDGDPAADPLERGRRRLDLQEPAGRPHR